MKPSRTEVALLPPELLTVTSTIPALCFGAVAVISVLRTRVNLVAGVEPKSTAVAFVNPVPLMVTLVPPPVGPLFGDTEITVGASGRIVRAISASTFPGRGVRLGWITRKKHVVQPASLEATLMDPETVAPCR